jgi:hypothetical protein
VVVSNSIYAGRSSGVLVQTEYLLLGQIAGLLNISPVLVFTLARVLANILMVLAIWWFAVHFVADESARWWAFLMAIFTGGAGWLLYLLMPAQTADLAPIEFWLLDAYTFTAAVAFPHFSAAVAALIAFFVVFDRWRQAPSWRGIGWMVILSVLLGAFQPFDLLLTALVVAVLSLWDWVRGRLAFRQVVMLAPVAAAHLVVVGYVYMALRSDPVWEAFTAQNLTLSPPPVYYIFGFIWLLIPAVIGGLALRRAEGDRWRRLALPLLWIVIVVPLLYAPLPTQRRFLLGVQVPLSVLAGLGLLQVRKWWEQRGWRADRWRLTLVTLFLFSTLTHVLFVASAALTVHPETRPLLFLTADEQTAYDWLRDQPVDSVVLSAFSSGGKIPAFTGRRVYIGHWIETMDFDARLARTQAFFSDDGLTDSERRDLLDTFGIAYVWHDPAARSYGGWNPADADYLHPVLETPTVTVYEVAR